MVTTYPRNRPEQALLEQHSVLVRRIAHHLLARMPGGISLDDLVQAGMMGLMEALRKYDGSRGASFETYAGIRIRGAMLDEVRRTDWAPRSVHRNSRQISEAIRQLEHRLGRSPSEREIADEMGMTLDEYFQVIHDALSSRLFSFESLVEDGVQAEQDHGDDVLGGFSRERLQIELAEAIRQLPEREALVLSLYYDEELNLKEIGEVLGVSESRISQIHSQAVVRLRSRLSGWR